MRLLFGSSRQNSCLKNRENESGQEFGTWRLAFRGHAEAPNSSESVEMSEINPNFSAFTAESRKHVEFHSGFRWQIATAGWWTSVRILDGMKFGYFAPFLARSARRNSFPRNRETGRVDKFKLFFARSHRSTIRAPPYFTQIRRVTYAFWLQYVSHNLQGEPTIFEPFIRCKHCGNHDPTTLCYRVSFWGRICLFWVDISAKSLFLLSPQLPASRDHRTTAHIDVTLTTYKPD